MYKLMLLALVIHVVSMKCKDTSQYAQTSFFLSLHREVNGTYIEFGCGNGIHNSNTYMLECMGWTGFCVEPVNIIQNRAFAYNGAVCPPGKTKTSIAVASKDGLHGEKPNLDMFGARVIDTKIVQCYNLNQLRKKHRMNHVTYMTVDTEGNELELLLAYSPIDWVTWLQVECNTRYDCIKLKRALHSQFKLVSFISFGTGEGGGDLLFKHK